MSRPLVLTITFLVLLIATPAPGADRDEHLEYWSNFVGEWQLENDSLEMTITRTDGGSCFIFETPTITFVHGWDPAEQRMRVLSFYEDGAHGMGHATIEDDDMVGQSHTVNPDGTTRDATWRITGDSDARFEFTTGAHRFVFNRQN